MTEEKCYLCQAFDSIVHLLGEGHDLKDAFHTVVDDLIIDTQHDSFEDGYVTALTHVNNHTSKTIKDILDIECKCDECNGDC